MPWIEQMTKKPSSGPKCPRCGKSVPRLAPPPNEIRSSRSGELLRHEPARHSCGEELVTWEWEDAE